MDPSVVVEAIQKHLEALESVTNFAFLLALTIGLTAWYQGAEFDLRVIKLKREDAGIVATVVFFCAGSYIMFLFWKIIVLLDQVQAKPTDYALKAISELSLNKWPMNPFSTFNVLKAPSRDFLNHMGYLFGILTYFAFVSSIFITRRYRPIRAMVAIGFAAIVFLVVTGFQVHHIFEQITTIARRLAAAGKLDKTVADNIESSEGPGKVGPDFC